MSYDVTDVYNETLPDGQTTVQAYMEMTDEERDSYWDDYISSLSGKSAEEIEESVEEAKSMLEQLVEDTDDVQDALNDLESGLTSDEEAQVEEWDTALQDIEETLNEAQDLLQSSQDEELELKKDYTDGSDATISDDSLDLDGDTYVYSLAGGSQNPFGTETADQSDTDYLIEQGVIDANGAVIQDVDGNQVYNYDDITAGLEARNDEDDLTKQGVYISGNYNWDLVTVDGSTYTFKVSDPSDPDKFCYVTLENAADVSLYWSGGIDSGDVDTIKNNWPPDLKKISYWADTGTTFEEMTADDSEIADATRYSALQGYTDCQEAIISSTVMQYSDMSNSISSDCLDLLYSLLDDPTQSASEVWGEIYQLMAGMSQEQQAGILQSLIVTVALNAPQNFDTFFGPVAGTLENLLCYYPEDISANSKLSVLLIESLTVAGGLYGGSTGVWTQVFSIDGITKGLWADNSENLEVITQFKSIMSLGGNLTSGGENLAYTQEEEFVVAEAAKAASVANYVDLYGQAFVDYVQAYYGDISQMSQAQVITYYMIFQQTYSGTTF